jgi:hypothetical protein
VVDSAVSNKGVVFATYAPDGAVPIGDFSAQQPG